MNFIEAVAFINVPSICSVYVPARRGFCRINDRFLLSVVFYDSFSKVINNKFLLLETVDIVLSSAKFYYIYNSTVGTRSLRNTLKRIGSKMKR